MWSCRKYIQSETALTLHLALTLLSPCREPIVWKDPKSRELSPVPHHSLCSQPKIIRKESEWAMPPALNTQLAPCFRGLYTWTDCPEKFRVTFFFSVIKQSPASQTIQPHLPLPSVDIHSHVCHEIPWFVRKHLKQALEPGEKGCKVFPFKLFHFGHIPEYLLDHQEIKLMRTILQTQRLSHQTGRERNWMLMIAEINSSCYYYYYYYSTIT